VRPDFKIGGVVDSLLVWKLGVSWDLKT